MSTREARLTVFVLTRPYLSQHSVQHNDVGSKRIGDI